MKILAFAATSSRQSINKQLVQAAADIVTSDLDQLAEIEILDLNDYEMPIYSIDRENEGGIPEEAKRFYEKIGAADAVIISYAEHNGTYTAAFKNVFDWASRISMKVFQGKPQIILSASMGPGGAASVLKSALGSAGFFGADVRGSLSVGPFGEKFDIEAGTLTDDALNESLREALKALLEERSAVEEAA
ncbi:MAG: NAD(P)H-dependent oxidoreductase [Roseibium sp.]|uniref:NADPH-dependent FMN reductase n=1 Tax=Sulfitobacter sp. TaxID=1903071 RepID=UPI00329A4EC6